VHGAHIKPQLSRVCRLFIIIYTSSLKRSLVAIVASSTLTRLISWAGAREVATANTMLVTTQQASGASAGAM
jgi:hypothetical protein